MHIAVTGATGFIGRNVVAALLRDGRRVTVIVRSGRAAAAGEMFGKTVKIVEHDLTGPFSNIWASVGHPDVCIHLAWGHLNDLTAIAHLDQELPMQQQFLEALLRSGLPRLLVTGTCFEYGMQTGALHEDFRAAPVIPYGKAKDDLRQYLEALQIELSFELAWARLFHVYSETTVRRTLLTQLAEAVARGDRSFPMSHGNQLRDYLSADRQAELIARLAVARGSDGIFNVCSGNPITVRSLVERWIADRGWKIELDLGKIAIPAYEPSAFWGDNRRLNDVLR